VSDTVIERSPSVLSRRAGAAWLVTTQEDPDVHELRGGAAIVWERLEQPSSVEVIAAGLETDGARAADLRSQVAGVVDTLRNLGVLREVDQ
jgi:hypothetical protein